MLDSKTVVETLKDSGYKEIYHDIDTDKIIVYGVGSSNKRTELLKTIAIQFKADRALYKSKGAASGRTGWVEFPNKIQIHVKNPIKQGAVGKKGKSLSPKSVVPSIINVWLSNEEMVERVKLYLNTFEIMTDDTKEKIFKLLDDTIKNTNLVVNFDGTETILPSEFYEVLTSAKLATLLKSDDARTKQILGIPRNYPLRNSKIKIYIPGKSNFPLIDYSISIAPPGVNEKNSRETCMKISVKSKKEKSKDTNTVKFQDVFNEGGLKEVNDWYNTLPSNIKRMQKGQKTIAGVAVEQSKNWGKGMLYPLIALYRLIGEDAIKNIISTNFLDAQQNKSVVFIDDLLRKIINNYGSINATTLLSDKKLNISDSLLRKSALLIQTNVESMAGNIPEINVQNISLICEKILVKASRKDNPAKYNFYQMFYDKVLKEKSIAYAIAESFGKSIRFKYLSKINWAKEYHDWIILRTQNSMNRLKGALGMNI